MSIEREMEQQIHKLQIELSIAQSELSNLGSGLDTLNTDEGIRKITDLTNKIEKIVENLQDSLNNIK